MTIKLTKKQTIFYSAVFDDAGRVNLKNDLNEFASFGGFGSAKSFIVMLCTLIICLAYPGTEWVYARATYPQLEDSVIKQFRKAFDPEQFHYVYRIQKREAHFSNGSKIYFRAFDVDTKILSNQYHGASLCQAEEVPFALFSQLWGRLRLNGIGKNLMLLEGNPAPGWCKARYKDREAYQDSPAPDSRKVFFLESTSFDNPYNPPEYIENMISRMPETWVKRYIYGSWENLQDAVFSEFLESVHVVEPFHEIPITWSKTAGMDYGYKNPSAIVWGAIDYDDNIYIYDEFFDSQKTPDQLSIEAKRHGNILVVIDPSTKKPDRDGKDVFHELITRGVSLRVANKDKKRNITTTNMLFKQRRLFITKNCVNLIREIKAYHWKSLKIGEEQRKDYPEEVVKKDDHAVDALMYLLAHIVDLWSEKPSHIRPEQTLHYHIMNGDYRNDMRRLG